MKRIITGLGLVAALAVAVPTAVVVGVVERQLRRHVPSVPRDLEATVEAARRARVQAANRREFDRALGLDEARQIRDEALRAWAAGERG